MAAADQDELEQVGRLLQATDEPEDARRTAFERLIGLARSANPAVKAQVGSLLPTPFTAFPDLQERAVDVVYDLCEDEDSAVRRSGYACFALLSASSPAWIQRNTDVLSQLLAVDAAAERAQIRGLIGEHVRLAPAKALGVVFDVLEDAEAGTAVQDELFECLREGQLTSTGTDWEAAFREGGERLLSSTKVTLSEHRALLVLKALARLPVDSSSTSTALADRSLAYPGPLAEPYAYSNGGYSSLAASLPHDPRPLTYALVRQLEKQPSVPLPASSIFRPDEARSEKALVASLGEWATLADDIGSGAPALIEERRWEEHQRTVVSNLTLKTLSFLRAQPLPIAMLEYLLWALYHLHHIPHVDRRTIGPGSAFHRTIASQPLPVLPLPSSPLARPTANLTALLRFFRSPTARRQSEAGLDGRFTFAPPSSATSGLAAGVGPLAHLVPSWLPESSRPPHNGGSGLSETQSHRQRQQQQPALAPRTSAGQMMDRPGPTSTRFGPLDRRLPSGSRSSHHARLGEFPSSFTASPVAGPSAQVVAPSLRPLSGGAPSGSLLSRISPNTSGTSTPRLIPPAAVDSRSSREAAASVPNGLRGADRPPPRQQQQQQAPPQDLIEGFSIAGKAAAGQPVPPSGSAAEPSSASAKPVNMGISIKGRGARQAPPMATSAASSGGSVKNGGDPVERLPALPPARGLLERLGGSSSGASDRYSDEAGDGSGGRSRRKRKSEGDGRRGRRGGGGGGQVASSEGNKQARF